MTYGEDYAIFVGGLSWFTTDRELVDAFACFGNILSARIYTDKFTGRSRGFGFIAFDNHRGMINAIREMSKANYRRKGEYVEPGYNNRGYLSSGRTSFERRARSMEREEYRCFNCGCRGHKSRDCSFVGSRSRPSSPSGSWFGRYGSDDSFGEDRGPYEDEQCDRDHGDEDHFDSKHDDRYKQCEKCKSCSTFQKGEGNGEACLTAVNFSQENSRTMLATMVLLDELPFKLVESEKFQKFCRSLQPEFVIPSRITIIKDWFQIYSSKTKRLKNILTQNSQRVCFTIDIWTSVLQENYMVLTALFIHNSWDLHEIFLNFCHISNCEEETIV